MSDLTIKDLSDRVYASFHGIVPQTPSGQVLIQPIVAKVLEVLEEEGYLGLEVPE